MARVESNVGRLALTVQCDVCFALTHFDCVNARTAGRFDGHVEIQMIGFARLGLANNHVGAVPFTFDFPVDVENRRAGKQVFYSLNGDLVSKRDEPSALAIESGSLELRICPMSTNGF